MKGLLGPMMVIVWKDVLLELRSRDLVVSVVVFGLLVVVVFNFALNKTCLLYTSDAADDSLRVDLGGRRIIK